MLYIGEQVKLPVIPSFVQNPLASSSDAEAQVGTLQELRDGVRIF